MKSNPREQEREHDYDQEESEEDDESNQSESDEMSEGDDDDDASENESEHHSLLWSSIKEEAKERHREDYEELVQKFLQKGMTEEKAKEKGFQQILPKLRSEARNIYLDKLKEMRELRKDPIHKKVMDTKQRFIDEDGFGGEEALEAAVQKRKFLLNKMFEEDDVYDDSDSEED